MLFSWLSGWGKVVIWESLALRINALGRCIWRRFHIGAILVLDLLDLLDLLCVYNCRWRRKWT
jgi:hypothetical protein